MAALHNPNHDHSFNLYCPKRSPWSRGFSIKQSIRRNLPQLRTRATYKHIYTVFEEANASPNLPQQDRTLVDKIKLYGSKPPYPADRITPVLPPNPKQRERKREIHSTPLHSNPCQSSHFQSESSRTDLLASHLNPAPLLPRRRSALSSSSRPQHSKGTRHGTAICSRTAFRARSERPNETREPNREGERGRNLTYSAMITFTCGMRPGSCCYTTAVRWCGRERKREASDPSSSQQGEGATKEGGRGMQGLRRGPATLARPEADDKAGRETRPAARLLTMQLKKRKRTERAGTGIYKLDRKAGLHHGP